MNIQDSSLKTAIQGDHARIGDEINNPKKTDSD
jgi:hypothetical protein